MNLKSWRRGLFFVGSIFATLILMLSCGGGGGGGGGSSLTPAVIDQSTSRASVGLAMTLNEVSEGLTGMVENFSPASVKTVQAPITPLIGPIRDFIENELYISGQTSARGGSLSDSGSCSDGGSASISLSWDGPNEPVDCSDVANLECTASFSDCDESLFHPYVIDGAFTFSFSGSLCSPTGLSVQYTDYSISSDSPSYPDYYQMDSFSINIDEVQYNNDIVTHQTIIFNGDLEGHFSGYSFSAGFNDYTTEISTADDFNYSIEISGSLTGGCIDGWVTVETVESIQVSDGFICPTAGQLILHGDGEMMITFNPDGSVDIGDTHYNSCNDVANDCI